MWRWVAVHLHFKDEFFLCPRAVCHRVGFATEQLLPLRYCPEGRFCFGFGQSVLPTEAVGILLDTIKIVGGLMKLLSGFHIHRVEDDVIVEPHLSRGKCACSQIFNYLQATYRCFLRKFWYFLLQYYRKYDIIQVQYNSRKKTNNNPASNVQWCVLLLSCSRLEARCPGETIWQKS